VHGGPLGPRGPGAGRHGPLHGRDGGFGPGRHGPGALLAGFTMPAVLLLLAHGGETHGYALREALESNGLVAEVEFGNLYRALRRMEEAGLVASRWETVESGPGRRVYALRPEGMAFLAHLAVPLGRARAALDRFFAMYDEVRKRAEGSDQR
jgi:PadR family transcriptional regulator PadR